MGARSFKKKLQENYVQRTRLVQHEVFSSVSASPPSPTSPLPYYTPIFLSPSPMDMIPSPSPLPAAAGSSHPVSTAAIVGGSVAGVVALVATATIVSTVAGKAGLSCLLLPICKLLSFLGKSLLGSACGKRLKSLWNILDRFLPARKRRRSNEEADEEDDRAGSDQGDVLYEILTGESPTRSSKAEESTTVVKGQDVKQLQTTAQAYLVTTASDFAESELKKAEEIMMQPLHQKMTKTQAYAESFLSVANRVKASEDTALSKSNKADEDVGRANVKTSNSHTVASEKLQGPEVREEEVLLHSRRKRPPITSTNVGAPVDESEGEELKQRVVLNDESKKGGQVCIVESASDAFTELQVLEETAGAPAASHDADDSMAIVSADTGGTLTDNAASGTMISLPTKALVQGKTTTSATKGKRDRDVVRKVVKGKHKRPSSLGHVSFACELSAHRLRFFTSCKSGGTYGSPPASPDDTCTSNNNNHHCHHDNYYCDNSITQAPSHTYSSSSGQSNSAYHQLCVPLYNVPHYSHMHQPLYQPSQSILVQRNTSNATPPSTHHVATISHAPFIISDNIESPSQGQPNPSIDDYGGPFDGVL